MARLDDLRQLKAELVREFAALREIAAERQKVFEGTLQNFSHRVKSLMEPADRALYDAKHLGKNRVVSTVKPTLRELRTH